MFRVLITDDHAGCRQALRELLREQFPRIEVSEVSHCQQALQQLDSLDLLFLDISLPQENGLLLAAKIKSEHPDLLISILSIHDAPEYRQAALQHGADYFVSKGSPAEQILGVLQTAIADGQAHSPKRAYHVLEDSFTPASPPELKARLFAPHPRGATKPIPQRHPAVDNVE